MSKQGTIIVVDDNKGVLSAVKLLLKNHFEHIVTLPSPITLPAALREENAQVVLLDMNFSSGLNTGNEGLYWLHEIKKIHPSLPVVLFTAYADIDLAVRGIKEGATDFIVKPWDNVRLIETLLSACRNSSKNKKRAEVPKTVSSMYWGESNAMKQLRTLIEKVAQTDANILITGENGTGKEMLAREIHALSARYRRDMITVDMGAITESLFESELFGHERGAFTSAIKQRKGKFEQASGGTLFMDEIGDMSLAAQAKVLRALQERKISRVGSDKDVDVDVRIIAATNKNLREEIKKGNFREDLFHRIGVILIKVPPLREHSEDIPLLVDHFIDMICEEYDMPRKPMDKKAVEMLRQMPWTGNIRELRNVIERLVVLSGTKITPNDVELYCYTFQSNSRISPGRSTTWSAPCSYNSARSRKPQVTPTDRTPAARAVSISTPESPAYSTAPDSASVSARISRTTCGSGLSGTPGR